MDVLPHSHCSNFPVGRHSKVSLSDIQVWKFFHFSKNLFRIEYGVECKVKWTFRSAADCQEIIRSSFFSNCTSDTNEFCQVEVGFWRSPIFSSGNRLRYTPGQLLLAEHSIDSFPMSSFRFNRLLLKHYSTVDQTQQKNGRSSNHKKLTPYENQVHEKLFNPPNG